MPIVVDQSFLKGRINEVRRLLIPISKSVSAHRQNSTPTEYVLGAVGQNMQNSGPTRDWRFKTKNNDYYANYTEMWVPLKGNDWNLIYAYLTIFNGPFISGTEVLALHCDPNEPKSSKFYKYKCGPHMHIHHTNDVIKSAHIALNLSNFDKVIGDINEMNEAFREAIGMIVSEFLK